MQPDARHTRRREAVAGERRAMVELLQELVRTPSVGGTPGESELQQRLARDFAASGLETDLWPLPQAELEGAPDFPGVEVARQDTFGLVGRLKGSGGGPTLMLNGHVDPHTTCRDSLQARTQVQVPPHAGHDFPPHRPAAG